MSLMKITAEVLTPELFEEIIPLGQESWDECSKIKRDTCAYHGQRGLPIDLNAERYFFLATNNCLITMTVRDDEGVLQGYASLITYYSLHLKDELCGNVDSFYIRSKYRQCMSRFISTIEDEFNSRGVSIIGWPVTRAGGLYKILKKRGYIADDVVMELKLKDIQGDKSCV